MNNVLYALGWVLIGAGLGGGASALYFKKYYDAIARDEIDSVKKIYRALPEHDTEIAAPDDVPKESQRRKPANLNEQMKSDIPIPGEDHSVVTSLVDTKNDRPYVDYSGKGRPVDGDPDVRAIAFELFAENVSGYHQASLTYYEKDDILADESDEVITDEIYHLGNHAVEYFKDGSDVLYFRNDRNSWMYEVIRHEGSYHEVVLGEDAEE